MKNVKNKNKKPKFKGYCECGKEVYAKGICSSCYQKKYWKEYKKSYIRKSRSKKENQNKGFAVSLFFRKDNKSGSFSERMVSAITNSRNEWEAFGKVYDSFKETLEDFDLVYKTVIEIEKAIKSSESKNVLNIKDDADKRST